MRLRTFAFASIVVVGIGMASAATPAQAAEKPVAKRPRHCVTNLSQPKAPTVCFSSFTMAIAKATGGRITDAPNNASIAMRDQRLQARLRVTGAKKSVPVGGGTAAGPISIMYDNTNYLGSSLIYTGSKDCTVETDDVDYAKAVVGTTWDNRISSYKSYRRCYLRLYQDNDFDGASLEYAGSRTGLGSLNNAVSSIRWS